MAAFARSFGAKDSLSDSDARQCRKPFEIQVFLPMRLALRVSNLVLVGNLSLAFWWRRRESNSRVKSEENRVELPQLLPPQCAADLNA